MFLRGEVVSTSPKSTAGLPPIIDCLRLFIQYIHSYPTHWRTILHSQPVEAPHHCHMDPHIMENIYLKLTIILKSVSIDYNDFNISILINCIIYGKDSSGCIQYRNPLVSRKPVGFSAITLSTEVDTWIDRNRQ